MSVKARGIWHERLGNRTDPVIRQFTSSVKDDRRLIAADIRASIAHVAMLRMQRIIRPRTAQRLIAGLKAVRQRLERGRSPAADELEDIHMNIESQLERVAGADAAWLHTARSRNDLVATDLRLFARDAVGAVGKKLAALQQALLANARRHRRALLPGYTHLQRAQPVSWSFYMLAHFFRLQRDWERLCDARKRIGVLPLGAGALAGTGYDTDPGYMARLLAFDRTADNALDAVADRDFLCEVQSCFVSLALHLGQLAEDIIVFSTREFNLVELDDSIATGSSMLPQKKNADCCELLRAAAARSVGDLVAQFCILKGLPSSYNRDLQDTKKVFFRHYDDISASLDVAVRIIRGVAPVAGSWPERPDLSCAADVVDHQVKRGVPFRHAYDRVARCVRQSRGDIEAFIGCCVLETGISAPRIRELLRPDNSVKAKISSGSTGPAAVGRMMRRARELIRKNKTGQA